MLLPDSNISNLKSKRGRRTEIWMRENNNETEKEFLKKVDNYFNYGMETLRYLMDLMNANGRFNKILQAYDRNNIEDVMK